jgi:phosphatidate cytidylyltransferase
LSNLSVRVLVAVAAIPLILLLAMAGGFYFFAFVAVVSTVGLHEFYRIAKTKGAEPNTGLGMSAGLCFTAAFMHARLQYMLLDVLDGWGIAVPLPSMPQMFLILVLLFVGLILTSELFRNRGSAFANITATIVGVFYVSFFLGTLVGLRELFVPSDFPVYRYFDTVAVSPPPDVADTIDTWGGLTIIAVFASIWMCDSAAYFAGRAFGAHRLFPRVSPNKTWEGACAGLVFAVASFVGIQRFMLPYLEIEQGIVCGAIVGIFGQLGDLVESLLKRDAGLKDSSTLIPGHGGVLDRFDSLLFVSPLIYLYIDFIVF